MSIIQKTLGEYFRVLRGHPLAVGVILACFAVVLGYTFYIDRLLHGVGYLGAVVAGGIITDIIVLKWPKETVGFPIKKPVKQELALIIICTLLGLGFLIVRFFIGWESLMGLVKLMLLPFILFAFPVVLGLVYLFKYKYKLKELGVNLNYWYLPLILHLLWGAVTLTVAPDKSHWKEAWVEYGVVDMLFTGIVTAALSEEFVRMLFQTRIGNAVNNFATGFVIASAIWAFMHVPVFFRDNPDGKTYEAVIGAVCIMPLGFFWGYLTYRTKSMIPAILMHGFNLWGLQNM